MVHERRMRNPQMHQSPLENENSLCRARARLHGHGEQWGVMRVGESGPDDPLPKRNWPSSSSKWYGGGTKLFIIKVLPVVRILGCVVENATTHLE